MSLFHAVVPPWLWPLCWFFLGLKKIWDQKDHIFARYQEIFHSIYSIYLVSSPFLPQENHWCHEMRKILQTNATCLGGSQGISFRYVSNISTKKLDCRKDGSNWFTSANSNSENHEMPWLVTPDCTSWVSLRESATSWEVLGRVPSFRNASSYLLRYETSQQIQHS